MVTLSLDPSRYLPTILLPNGIDLLLDTGAVVPVFTRGEESLLKRYPKAKELNGFAHIRGFGGTVSNTSLYEIPELRISSDMCIYAVPIIVMHSDKLPNMVLPFGLMSRKQFYIINSECRQFITDTNKLYAVGRYSASGELLGVAAHTKSEVEKIQYGKELMLKDYCGNLNDIKKLVNDIYSYAPHALKSDMFLNRKEIAAMLYPSLRGKGGLICFI